LDRDNSENVLEIISQCIQEIINGPGSCGGYRTIWHTLEMEGFRIPHIIVQEMSREQDPEGSNLRKARRLKRRSYHNPGPNQTWHIDSYDKLITFGLPIHGAIDGYSRKILCLDVTHSNNSPDNIFLL
jgi:transposase InsO family protein